MSGWMMTEVDETELRLLLSTATHVFRAADGLSPDAGWRLVREAGLDLLAAPEPVGGGSLPAGCAVTRVAGETAAALPYADTALVAAPMLAEAGLAVPDGPCAAAEGILHADSANGKWRVRGTLRRVPWGTSATRIVVAAATGEEDIVVALDPSRADVSPGVNLAGDPCDTVAVDVVVEPGIDAAPLPGAHERLLRAGALARSLLTAGAASAVLRAAAEYATQRVQFGRPIARQQAVQHALAEIAGETEAVRAATEAAVGICASNGFGCQAAQTAIAVAKIQAGMTAEVVARLTHQVHGAIGTTQEHPLHRHTLRLWAWRDEFGAERAWQRSLGETALTVGVWEAITG
jgi:acyl-CoA dehydrogenase